MNNQLILFDRGFRDIGLPVVKLLILIFLTMGCNSCTTLQLSDHSDGRKFFNNPSDSAHQSFSDHIKWMWNMETVKWPEWVIDTPQYAPPAYVNKGVLRVTYINHATILIQMDSLNILTDPIFSDYAGPITFFGSKRVRKPGIAFDSLPKIDIVLISHNHFDHLDLPTLRILAKRDKPIVLSGLGNKKLLADIPFAEFQEMDWWQKYKFSISNINITFVPALHSSGRGLFVGNETLWGGFVISGASGHIYFAGDTRFGSFLNELHQRFPEFRLTISPIGSYEKRWFMKKQHMNPDDAVRAHLLLNSKQSIGMHYATFVEHPEQTIDQHEKDMEIALRDYKLPKEKFIILKFGEGLLIP